MNYGPEEKEEQRGYEEKVKCRIEADVIASGLWNLCWHVVLNLLL
jgi:hypothetical protein